MKLVERKVKAGTTHKVKPLESTPEETVGSNVVDLTAMLKNSLEKRKAGSDHRSRATSGRRRAAKGAARSRA